MAFPFLFQEHFEAGTAGAFDSETDTNSKLDFPHYPTLVPHPNLDIPWSGAYCMRINLALGTADAYLEELAGFDAALAATIHARFYLFVSTNLVMAASDRFSILQLQSAGPANEVTVDIRNNAGTIELMMVAEPGGGETLRATALVLGVWHAVELSLTIDSGVGNDGTASFFVDGAQVGAQVTALDQAAISQARMGAIAIDAGTTAGFLLFDAVIVDDTRVFPSRKRFSQTVLVTQSGHTALGPGRISGVNLVAGGAADNVVTVYDTDQGNTSDAGNVIAQVSNGAANETVETSPQWFNGGYFTRGCYINLVGTNPRALVTFSERFMSRGHIRSYARRRASHIV